MQTEQEVLATPGGDSSCSGHGPQVSPRALTGAGTGMSNWSEESGLLQVYLVKVEPQRQ